MIERMIYSIAPRIPPGRIEGSVPGRSFGSVGFPQGSLGAESALRADLASNRRIRPRGPGRPRGVPGGRWGGPWGALGVPRGVPGRPWGVSGGPWGGPREAPGGPWGPPGRLRKHVKFSEGVWGGSRGAPGVILVVWGGPRDRPERWKC